MNSRQRRKLATYIGIEGGWPVIIAGACVAWASGSSWAGIAFLFACKIFILHRRRHS